MRHFCDLIFRCTAFLFLVLIIQFLNGCGITSNETSDLDDINLIDGAFVTIWETENTIKIPGTGNNYQIVWEEIGNSNNKGSEIGTNEHTINVSNPGKYVIQITGDFTRINFGMYGAIEAGHFEKILEVMQWGDIKWETMHSAFVHTPNLNITADDAPDLSNVNELSSMFRNSTSMNGKIGHWDISNVKNLRSMFSGAVSFNQDLSNWDTGNITDMVLLFSGAISFNQDISGWNTSNVTSMWRMFAGASSFNQDIGNWDTSNVTTMLGMFAAAESFNSDISDWDVSKVNNMSSMLRNAKSFDQDISRWDISNVSYISGMFRDAVSFNQDISNWDISNVSDLNNMFSGAESFNQDIGNWNTSNVTNMFSLFNYASSFDQNLGNWDMSKVTGMGWMLNFANLSVENYDKTLIGWSEQELQHGISLQAFNLQYCNAHENRELIIQEFGWTIQDWGQKDGC